jgi:hypothetical protein
MWFLQMAQLSTTMSQAHNATAFHFFTSNLKFKNILNTKSLETLH